MPREALELQTKDMAAVRVLLLPMLMAVEVVVEQEKLVVQEHQHLVAMEAMVWLPQSQEHP
jgi:hypothetical protein